MRKRLDGKLLLNGKMLSTNSKIRALRNRVRKYFAKHGRALPWRKTHDPYRILVSEIMLQQTQVDRVVPKFEAFIQKFPTVHKLAKAPLSSVLKQWQGLGYNRRARMLHSAAQAIVTKHKGKFPKDMDALIALPGVGRYTAGAVRVFAWNAPEILVETNTRTVFIHHFFPKRKKVSDRELIPYMQCALDTKHPRLWYSALMDYGTHLKKTVPNPSRKSTHHTKQKPFKGSDREIRGAILKMLASGAKKKERIFTLPFERGRIETQYLHLSREGLVSVSGERVRLG